MTTTPTSNPIPSEAPQDLKFNAGKIDEFVTSSGRTYTDRFGINRSTIEGVNYLAQQAMNSFGYVTLTGVTFSTGATVNNPNEVLLSTANGEYYKWTGSFASGGKVVPSNSTPETTGGIGPGAWIGVGDASLRAQLSSAQDGFGDALVKVKQPLLNSASRTQHDKNADYITVEDFGAVGDGVADDTVAIQKALNTTAKVIMSSGNSKKFYKITDTLLMKLDGQRLDLGGSELVMSSLSDNKPHIIVGSSTQINANKLSNISFTNTINTTVYQILINNVGGFVVEGCVGYGSDGKRPYGFIDVTVATVGYIRGNATEGLIDASVRAKGTDGGENRAVDIAIYDNRFRGAVHAVRIGDYTEGLFIRRNIFYAQTGWQLLIEPSSSSTALVSGKIQDNDFDSPMVADGAIYMQFFKNVQITGNWFANTSQDPMIRLLNTDSVIIQGNQAYPQAAFLEDGGVNTDTTGNLIVGGKSQIYFTATANKTTVNANHMSGPSVSCVDTNGHTNSIKVMNNSMFPLASAVGINYPQIPPTTHAYIGNSGDKSIGTGRAVTMGASPATYTVGPRPEILAFKAGTITNISVNGVQMAVNSNVVIGPLPPASSVSVTYSGSTPGLSILQVF